MRRQFMILALAIALGIGFQASSPSPAAAVCGENAVTMYVDWFGNGQFATLCGSISNLANFAGPCANSNFTWDNCVSSLRITLGLTYCLRTYTAANYIGLMKVYWGAMGPNALDSLLNPNDALSSLKVYQKDPPTPAGNC